MKQAEDRRKREPCRVPQEALFLETFTTFSGLKELAEIRKVRGAFYIIIWQDKMIRVYAIKTIQISMDNELLRKHPHFPFTEASSIIAISIQYTVIEAFTSLLFVLNRKHL